MTVEALEPAAAARATLPHLRVVHPRADYAFRLARRPIGGSIKRAFDLAVAAPALIVLAPLLLLLAALVKASSPGPILFRQRRGGFRGRAFHVLKFRTMRTQEDGREVRQAVKGDARITPIGRFLRKSSLDELPQLINVIVGDMSLVGPRPHALAHDRAFYQVNNAYPRRFLARPGITGWAQINGSRGQSETPEKVEARTRLDLAYVEDWSFSRDLFILFATLKVLVHDKNAY